MKIIFFGSDSFVIPVLQALEENFEVAVVVTAPDSAVSRCFKCPILTPNKLDGEFLDRHQSLLSSDLIVVASYGKIIPQKILNIPRYGALNVHPSLLPAHRGPSPVPHTILSGDKETGVTIIKMDTQMDHGPIVAIQKITLSGQEDTPTLIAKLFRLGAEILVDTIPDFVAGKIKGKEQNHQKATFSNLLLKEDGKIDWSLDAAQIERRIRAFTPWPGTYTFWNGKRIKIHQAVVLEQESAKKKPGTVLPYEHAFAIETGNGLLLPSLIQMEGKSTMSAETFLRGYPTIIGSVLR